MKYRVFLFVAVLVAAAFTLQVPAQSTVNVRVWKNKIEPSSWEPSMFLSRDGIPTPAERAAFRNGSLRVVKFSTSATIFVDACVSFVDCAEAVNQTCVAVTADGSDAVGATFNQVCRGTCKDRTSVLVGCP